MIELLHVVKKFGELAAVNDLTLTVPRGECFVILGPNAAGKTTTLRLMSGLLKPTSGQVRVAGFDIQTHPLEARRRLAYVPEAPFLYDKLTPWEFFRFVGPLFQMEETRLRAAGEELVSRFHLEAFADHPIEGLSHGTRQTVALAAGLLHEPEVFIVDEPMAGLDPQHTRLVKDALKDRPRAGMPVFVWPRQLDLAEELADRIGILHQGRLVAAGTAEELRRQAGAAGSLPAAFLALTGEEAARTLAR
jgi:ABC-2 type transport system ATP-binding protein